MEQLISLGDQHIANSIYMERPFTDALYLCTVHEDRPKFVKWGFNTDRKSVPKSLLQSFTYTNDLDKLLDTTNIPVARIYPLLETIRSQSGYNFCVYVNSPDGSSDIYLN